jgi:purine-binding chemotaxis protein CheW
MQAAQAVKSTAPEDGLSILTSENLDDMYLSFSLGTEEYAVGIKQVVEIVGLPRIMAVPDLPDYIRGVINLRGKVIPLLDVRLRFRMQERAYDERTVVIVMDVDGAPIGLIVDGVTEVREIAPGNIGRNSNGTQKGTQSAIFGLGRIEDRIIVILDASVLTSDCEIVMAEVGAGVKGHA